MYELIQVSENCYYIQCPAKIGLVKTGEDRVCLIDSGNDKDAGKKVKKHLDANGWTLEAIYNTHSHADHIGGNQYLQNQTGCKIYASGIERCFAENTILEPSYLYGANPPKDLRHKFLLAKPSEVEPLTADCLPAGWEVIFLPGHSWDMVGFRTADDVVYLADSLSGLSTINKYHINFLVDVQQYLDTLEMVKGMKAKAFVPAHAEPTEDISPLADANIAKVHEVAEKILGICEEPVTFETILQRLFQNYGLLLNFEQHALVGSTVRSYLAWLRDQDRLDADFRDELLVWTRKGE